MDVEFKTGEGACEPVPLKIWLKALNSRVQLLFKSKASDLISGVIFRLPWLAPTLNPLPEDEGPLSNWLFPLVEKFCLT